MDMSEPEYTDKPCTAWTVGPKFKRAKGKDVKVGDVIRMGPVDGFGRTWHEVAQTQLSNKVFSFYSTDGDYVWSAHGNEFVQLHS